ncbi:MAG TPA: tryptophan--tRNA ligase [Eubacteriales bacterium]|jgi:tryptophanyl-tRNA synthetase|nr:tryptophan--tRNA ligase [Clostridia bacterium]HRR89214.1 tryptophan--tRNA ligase [Eubacteriales bacterium]HRU84709.1 tryptophan--tRNA ligase [Eubacteriales bacterium]
MEYDKTKKNAYSAVQPTSTLTLGNYLGAIKNWLKMQDELNCYFAVANLHALTVKTEPSEFLKNQLSLYAEFLAAGLDPKKAVIYFQSEVPEHYLLQWILACGTYIGELSRMTQFKDKSAKAEENINLGLLAYPVLMAADILLFQAVYVPVGQDQKQHIELARDLAIRYNNRYGNVFTVPEPYINATSAKINSLQNPTAKMSKSDSDANATIGLTESRDSIIKKFKRAVTDSGNEIIASEDKPGITNLLKIYAEATGKSVAEAEREFAGKGYGEFKLAVGEAVADMLEPIKGEYNKLIADKAYLLETASNNAREASFAARFTINKLVKKLGLAAV